MIHVLEMCYWENQGCWFFFTASVQVLFPARGGALAAQTKGGNLQVEVVTRHEVVHR